MINQQGNAAATARFLRTAASCGYVALAAILLILPALSPAQTPDDGPIRELIARLDRGETEAVRQALPDAVTKYQNHPGILYLQARVATDGIEAAKQYQSVLDNFPASEWADDALYNLYQYYYAMGLYKTAELRMQQLRKEYPESEHLRGKTASPGSTPAASGTRPSEPAAPPPATADPVEKSAPPTTTDQPAALPQDRPVADAAAAAPMPYTVQTGAFSTSENARKQKSWFEDLGYTAEITSRVRSGKSLFLVWVGNYASAEEARKVSREIQSRYNITPIVVER